MPNTLRDVAAAAVAEFREDRPGVTPTWYEMHWNWWWLRTCAVVDDDDDLTFDDYLRACQAAWAEE